MSQKVVVTVLGGADYTYENAYMEVAGGFLVIRKYQAAGIHAVHAEHRVVRAVVVE